MSSLWCSPVLVAAAYFLPSLESIALRRLRGRLSTGGLGLPVRSDFVLLCACCAIDLWSLRTTELA